MAYRAVCFDIDGTLYPAKTMNRRMTSITLRHPVFGLRYLLGRVKFRRLQGTFAQDVPFRLREAMLLEQRGKAEVAGSEKSRAGTYEKLAKWIYDPMEKLYEKTKPFDGVAETFRKIRDNGLKVGVLSDFPLFHKLESMGLADFVDFAASSDDTGFLKPDTHCFEYLLYNLKMDSADVLYVGDSYAKDIAGAHGAGIDAVLVNVRGSEKDFPSRYPLAKAVFSRWSDFDVWLSANMGDN